MPAKGQIKHGECHTPLYRIWANMKNKCSNPNHQDFYLYGARGITVCNKWMEYIPFRDWARANGYTEGFSIDRRDPDGHYEPSNCRWLTVTENCSRVQKGIYNRGFKEGYKQALKDHGLPIPNNGSP